jgi:hypothetical protein
MEKIDTRKLKPEVLQQLRHQAIRLRKKGMTYQAISDVIDVHYTTICGWWKTYEREGAKGIRLKTRGRKQGAKRTLNPTTLFNVLSNCFLNAFCDATNMHDGFVFEPQKFYQAKNPRFVSSSAVEV